MRAWLVVCAALALAPCRATAAHADPARLERIKSQILAKLGLTTRPTPLGAPPRDVVRQILARAADPHPHQDDSDEHHMREVIAIAHRAMAGPNHQVTPPPLPPAQHTLLEDAECRLCNGSKQVSLPVPKKRKRKNNDALRKATQASLEMMRQQPLHNTESYKSSIEKLTVLPPTIGH